jgi:chromosome segregation and condensation protein ScpB
MRRARLRKKLKLIDLVRDPEIGLALGTLSMLENGRRQPSDETRRKIEGALGMVPEGASMMPTQASPEVGDAVAGLGACLAVLRDVTLEDLALANDLTISEVRASLRLLSDALEPLGMRIIDDGSAAVLQPAHRVARVPAALTEPLDRAPLTKLQLGLLMMAVYRGGVTSEEVSRLREVDSYRVLDLLRRKGYLEQRKGSYRFVPTRLALEKMGADTFEELRAVAAATIAPEYLALLPDTTPSVVSEDPADPGTDPAIETT